MVIGLYVNGYGIVRELSTDPKIPIVGIDYNKDRLGLASKYLSERYIIDYNINLDLFINFLMDYGEKLQEKAVLFPTHDYHVKILSQYYEELKQYYHIPLNPVTSFNIISKKNQYEMCEKISVPYPKSFFIKSISDLVQLKAEAENLKYPLIIKPFSMVNNGGFDGVFRLKEIKNHSELEKCLVFIESNIKTGFLISEVVPGEPDNIWAYTAYCNENSEIIASWTGRKLTQKPYYYGVFSTARCEINPIVRAQGEKLLKAFNHIGIGEPEFKYDYRDNTYKLMEINPRYMMWHLVGWKGGVNLPLIQYYDMTNQKDELNMMQNNQNNAPAHIVFMPHEIYNLIYDHPKHKFIKNIWKALWLKNKIWAVWNPDDIMPSIKLQYTLLKRLGRIFWKM